MRITRFMLPAFFLLLLSSVHGTLSAAEDSLYDNMLERLTPLFEKGKVYRILVLPDAWTSSGERSENITAAKNLALKLALKEYLVVLESSDILPRLDALFRASGNQFSQVVLKKISDTIDTDMILFCRKTLSDGRIKLTVNAGSPRINALILNATVWEKTTNRNPPGAIPIKRKRLEVRAKLKFRYSITDFHLNKSPSGRLFISGIIHNRSNTIFRRPVLTVFFLDSEERIITRVKAGTDRDIFPGETLPFRAATGKKIPPFQKTQIRYYPVTDENTEYTGKLALRNRRLISSGKKYLVITGSVINKHHRTIYFPSVIASFYDGNRKFIGSAKGFTKIRKLPPGGISPFKVHISRKSLGAKAASFRCQFSGRISP